MRTRKKKVKQSIRDYQTLAFTLLTVAFFGFFAVRPSLSLILTLFHERSLYTKVNADLETKIQQIITLQGDYMKLLSKKELIDFAIPSSSNLQDLNTLLNPKMSLSTFGITEMLIKPPPIAGLVAIPVNIGGKSTYTDLVDYAHALYIAPRLFYMGSIDIGQGENTSSSAQLRFNATISTYYFIDN
jgi:Tfp pilus assembly protein PilO